MAAEKTITLDAAALDALVEAKVQARMGASKPAPVVDPTNIETSFQTMQKLRDEAEQRALPHQWVAFRSHTGAVGVAYVTASRAHRTGRVQTFSAYEEPPYEQMRLDGAPAATQKTKDGVEMPSVEFKQWKYTRYLREDVNSYVGKDAGILPHTGPRRATEAEALADVPSMAEERDREFVFRAKGQSVIAGPVLPLPKTEPASLPAAEPR